jgi:phosphinothricin acetyltransferase
MSDPNIRPAGPQDIPAITRIYAGHVAHGTATFEIEPPDEAEMARRLDALLANGLPYLVAEQAGVVAGYAYAGRYHVRPAYRWSVEDAVYIAPDFHRRGLGRLLMTRLIRKAEARGFRQMIAVIGDSANAASIALHAGVGFRPVGTLKSVGFKHGRWLDTVLMQRPLGPADTAPP